MGRGAMNEARTVTSDLDIEVYSAPSSPLAQLQLVAPPSATTPAAAHPGALVAKHLCDTVFAAFVAVLVLPVLAVIAIAIAITDGRPIFFRQSRVGHGGRIFTMYKFRTFPVDH